MSIESSYETSVYEDDFGDVAVFVKGVQFLEPFFGFVDEGTEMCDNGIGFGEVCRNDLGCFFLEIVVVDVLEKETGRRWFAEFDHDVAGV